MAVEQSGAEASSAEATQEDAAEKAAAPPDLDETKRKFREALDRKRSAHASAEGADHTGKVHEAHGPAPGRRRPPGGARRGRARLDRYLTEDRAWLRAVPA